MKPKPKSVISPRFLALCGCGVFSVSSAFALSASRMQATASYHNDVSRPLRELAAEDRPSAAPGTRSGRNPKIPNSHVDSPDPVVEKQFAPSTFCAEHSRTDPELRRHPFPGVGCNCAPPDTNGAVGLTQYVQMVNEGYQVFDKATGNSVLGPNSISSLWSGFGGACQTGGRGDPVVLYDQLANRWVISQFAARPAAPDH